MPIDHVCAWCLYRPEETTRSLGTGIASGCAMQVLRSQFLTKSSTHTSLLSPSAYFLRVLSSSLCLSSDILTLTCRALRRSKYPETCLSAPQSLSSSIIPFLSPTFSCLLLETSSTLIPCPQALWDSQILLCHHSPRAHNTKVSFHTGFSVAFTVLVFCFVRFRGSGMSFSFT